MIVLNFTQPQQEPEEEEQQKENLDNSESKDSSKEEGEEDDDEEKQNGEGTDKEDDEEDDSDDDINVVIGDIKTNPTYTSLNIKRGGLLTSSTGDKNKQQQQPGKFTVEEFDQVMIHSVMAHLYICVFFFKFDNVFMQ